MVRVAPHFEFLSLRTADVLHDTVSRKPQPAFPQYECNLSFGDPFVYEPDVELIGRARFLASKQDT